MRLSLIRSQVEVSERGRGAFAPRFFYLISVSDARAAVYAESSVSSASLMSLLDAVLCARLVDAIFWSSAAWTSSFGSSMRIAIVAVPLHLEG